MNSNHKVMMEREHLKALLQLSTEFCVGQECATCTIRNVCQKLYGNESNFANDVLIPCGLYTDGSEVEK